MVRLQLGMATFGFSLLTAAPALAQDMQNTSHAEIAAAETNLNVSLGAMHEQFDEYWDPHTKENGIVAGFGVGASMLLPSAFPNIDLYGALNYQFHAGNVNFKGYVTNAVTDETNWYSQSDRAVFNHVELRGGLGFPIFNGGAEVIPYATAGYMSWNRNDDIPNSYGVDELFTTWLLGLGTKLDVPLTPGLVASVSGQYSGLVGSSVTLNDFNLTHSMGTTGDERVAVGLDQAVSGPMHMFVTASWEHFNYTGFKPSGSTAQNREPFSTTTQFGANLGLSYSF
jgi:hypothetical protein